MTDNALVPIKQVVEYRSATGVDVALTMDAVRKYMVRGRNDLITNQEIYFFMGTCRARKLDPSASDCYLIKFTERDPAAIIVAIGYYTARAKAQPDCEGWKAGIIVINNGVEVKRIGALMRDGDELIGGWFEGESKDWKYPLELEVDLKAYLKKTSQGNLTQFWKPEKQPHMIRKIALSQGLRELWPGEFANTMTAEEILSEPAPRTVETITIEGEPVRDAVEDMNKPITQESMNEIPEIFGKEEPVEEKTELTPEEDAEVQYRALLKTFDVAVARLDDQRQSIANDILFEYLEKSDLTNLPDLKVKIIEEKEFEKFLEKVEERYDALDVEPAPLTEEPPEHDKGWLDPEAMLKRIARCQTSGLQKLAVEWAFMFDDTTFHAQHGEVIVEFAAKWKRLVGERIYAEGQPWEHPPGERNREKAPPEKKPETPMSDSYKVAIEDMMTKMTAKMGAEQADDAFMKVLGIVGYEKYTEITDPEHRKDFYKALGETLK